MIRAAGQRRVVRRVLQPLVILLAIAGCPSAGCRRAAARADDVTVDVKMTPAVPTVGVETLVEMTLLDRSHQPIRGASVRVEAHMPHPGMAPIVVAAREAQPGRYAARLSFSMNGTWTMFVTGELADGRSIRYRLADAAVHPSS